MNAFLSRSGRQTLSDMDILSNVEKALWREDLYRVAGRNSIRFEVSEGHVTLRGHVTSPMLRSQFAVWAQAAPGVKSVSNELVADADLTIEVAQALGRNPATRPHVIHVGAHDGWIHLGGEVPSAEVAAAAEAVAATVPHVRGVLTLPRVVGERPPRARRPIQPRPGQPVYATDGKAGSVAQVIVDPLNRLVSHIVVNTNFELGGRTIRRQVLVPAKALSHVSAGGVFVADTLETVVARPDFRVDDFEAPRWQWQPPFPYNWGDLLWPAQPVRYVLPLKHVAARVEAWQAA
jgi:osmotically-inducible protein OsmY